MKLDIGSGLNLKKPLDEWTHLDCDRGPHIEICCDFGHIPLIDGAVDEIWAGDVIEHIPCWRWREVLTEWNRVLKGGGTLGGTTPNLEYNVRQYVDGGIDLGWLIQNLYGDRAGYPHQHYYLFVEDTLDRLLQDYGFDPVDFSGSPGGRGAAAWWLVFKTKKVRDV